MVVKLNGDVIGDKTADFCLSPTLDAGEGRMCGCEGGGGGTCVHRKGEEDREKNLSLQLISSHGFWHEKSSNGSMLRT